jgi:protein arginine kinase activator
MKCQKCDEKSLFHITEIDEAGEFSEIHLCWRHAQEYMKEPESEVAIAPLEKAVAAVPPTPAHACPICKMTFAQFRNSARLGCPNDYRVFEAELRPIMENIHGSLSHVGKTPRRSPAGKPSQLLRLRQDLHDAVAREDYEQAAKLRDEIERMEAVE